MRAITVRPGTTAPVEVADVAEPDASAGAVLVEGLLLGICGTDVEVASGAVGEPPPGTDRMVLGHEAYGVVREAPAGSPIKVGDHVCAVVREPDPEPCAACARGESDNCRNGRFTEHGIKGVDGFGSQWWRVEPARAIKLAPELGELAVLTEPASVAAKAWETIEAVGSARGWYAPQRVLVNGAGPIGLLCALVARQHGYDVSVLDVMTDGPKPDLVRALGATYVTGLDDLAGPADVVVDTAAYAPLLAECLLRIPPRGIVSLVGFTGDRSELSMPLSKLVTRMVMNNGVVLGSVNANLRHFAQAADALQAADADWLSRLLTRRVPLERAAEALERRPGDIKTVVDLQA